MVELLLGKEHFLNLPNCILGIVFYSLQLCLGWYNFLSWMPEVLSLDSFLVIDLVGTEQ